MDMTRATRLAVSLLGGWIFAGGTGTLLLAVALTWIHYPEKFEADWPTLSECASAPPADAYFTVGMTSVGLAIMMGWGVTYFFNGQSIRAINRPALAWLNGLVLVFGLAQGLSVAGLGLFRLHQATDLHIASSYGTFIAGCLAFLTDALGATRWQRVAGPRAAQYRRRRVILAVTTALVAVFFLVMYLTKHDDPFGNYGLTRFAYCGSEIALAVLSFGYALLYTLELADRIGVPGEPATGRLAA